MIIEQCKKEFIQKQINRIRFLLLTEDRKKILEILQKEIERREEIEKNEPGR